MNIAGIAIRKPVFIVMIVLSIITLGLLGYSNLPWDLMPNVDFPTVSVTVIYPGASAEEMETIVAKPLEDAFSTLEGLDKVTTSCREGMTMINVAFTIGTDVKFAEIKVRDKVAATKPTLPDDIQEPIISKFSFSDIPIQFMSLSGKRTSADLREMLEDDIKPQIERIPGVASISIFGGQKKIVKIEVNKALLLASGISTQQISSAISSRNLNFPVGVVEGTEKNITVRILGEFVNVDEIANLPITSNTGKTVRIKDVAKVSFTLEDETVMVRVAKTPAVMFAVLKQSGSNSVDVANSVMKAVKEIQKTLPSDIKLSSAGDTTKGIKRSVEGILENIIIGAILAILIVWLFLGNFRSAMITAIALPNSIIGAFFLMMIAGFSINTITLLSLSLAVGLLIDDSIVVRENIFRHIEEGMEPKQAAEFGTNEVALAVVSTTLSIMAVFLPISFLSGMIGQFFKQFGLTVAFSLAISLLDAFTTAPMLSAYWYKVETGEKKGLSKIIYGLSDKWNIFYADMSKWYGELLNNALNHKKAVMYTAAGLFIGSFFIVPFLGKSFMNSDSGMIMASLETYSGAPLTKTSQYVGMLEDFISKEKDIDSYFVMAGADMAGTAGTNRGSLLVSMKPLGERKLKTDQESERIRQYLKDSKLDRYINLNISSSMGGGDDSYLPVLINVTGDDLKVLENLSSRIKKIVQETPGAVDADVSLKPGLPEVVLSVDPIKSEKLGISTYEIGTLLRTLMQGTKITNYKKGEKQYDITMQIDKDNRRTVDDLKNLIITNRMGRKMPLTSVVDLKYTSGPAEIRRENKVRIVKVTANVGPSSNVGTVNDKIKKAIEKEIIFPKGYVYTIGGQSKQFASLGIEMGTAMLLALLFMYMILASLYNSFIQPLYIMVAVPLAVIGVFLALLITGYNLDLFGFIGMLMVLGLVAKNGILLLDFTNKKREQGMSIREAILHAAPIRLRPIIMTTLAMIFGMLPIAMSLGEGSKGRESLATVVIGGLLTSTILTLIVVPAVYEYMENRILRNKEKKAKLAENTLGIKPAK
jgi:hydrophobic/amphiphilic exporter-1 (mainly G- bacteria), HAE1 family